LLNVIPTLNCSSLEMWPRLAPEQHHSNSLQQEVPHQPPFWFFWESSDALFSSIYGGACDLIKIQNSSTEKQWYFGNTSHCILLFYPHAYKSIYCFGVFNTWDNDTSIHIEYKKYRKSPGAPHECLPSSPTNWLIPKPVDLYSTVARQKILSLPTMAEVYESVFDTLVGAWSLPILPEL
jgi:hypothetical protein